MSETKVWERNRDQLATSGTAVRAFHWGSLTSGTRLSAFWILLAPFALSNTAGWMCNGRRWPQALFRLSALGMTALLTAQAAVTGVDYVTQLVADGRWPYWAAVVSPIGLAVFLVATGWRLSTRSQLSPFDAGKRFGLVFGVTRESLLPPEPAGGARVSIDDLLADPAEGADLSGESMWKQQAVLHRLRRLHLSIPPLIMALVVAWGGNLFHGWVVAGLIGLIASATLLTFGRGMLQAATVLIARYALWVSIGVLVWVVLSLDASDLFGGPWPHAHEVVFYAAGVTLAAVLAGAIAMAPSSDPAVGALVPAGAVTIGTLFGGALGAASALIAEFAISRWLPGVEGFQPADTFEISKAQIMNSGGDWVAVAMLAFVLGIIAIASVSALIASGVDHGLPPRREGRGVAMLRRATLRGRVIFGLTGGVGLALAVAAAAVACGGDAPGFCSPGSLRVSLDNAFLLWVIVIAGTIAVGSLVAAIARVNGAMAVVVFLATATLSWVVWAEPAPFGPLRLPVLELPVDLTRLVDLSIVLMWLGLSLLILRSIIGGLGDPDQRRKVGVLWDTGSFWPRWFHPLAPTAYGPSAVLALREALPAASDKPFVLAAHSQGSVIAVTALARAENLPDGLLTYGSPLGHLYERLFPGVGVGALCERVREQLGPHWINLWRDTDYLGGLEVQGANNWSVRTGTGHSAYELTPEFCQARKQAIAGEPDLPDVVPADCWET